MDEISGQGKGTVAEQGPTGQMIYPNLASADEALHGTPQFLALRSAVFASVIMAVHAYSDGSMEWSDFVDADRINEDSALVIHGIKKATSNNGESDDIELHPGVVISMRKGFTEKGSFDESQFWLNVTGRKLPAHEVLIADPEDGSVDKETISYDTALGQETADFMTAFGYPQVKIGAVPYDTPDLGNYADKQGMTFALTPLPEGSRFDFFANIDTAPEHRQIDQERFVDFPMTAFADLDQSQIRQYHANVNGIETEANADETKTKEDLQAITDEHKARATADMHRRPDFRRVADTTLFQMREAADAYEVGIPYDESVPLTQPTPEEEAEPKQGKRRFWQRSTQEPAETTGDLGSLDVAIIPAIDDDGTIIENGHWLNVHVTGRLPTPRIAYYDYTGGIQKGTPFEYSAGVQQEVIEYMNARGYKQVLPSTPNPQIPHQKLSRFRNIAGKEGIVFELESE